MKKLSEVCKIVGVTRRTLQEYDKIDLLKPTSKTESGYWLYDDAAIQKLIVIQIFVEGGYERKAIKTILDSPTVDVFDELDRLIGTLEERRKRLAGMINTIKTLKVGKKLLNSTLRALDNVDIARVYKDKSFAATLEDYAAELSTMDSAEMYSADEEAFILLTCELFSIGYFKGIPENSKCVQDAVHDAYISMVKIILSDDECSKMTDVEMIDIFLEWVKDLMNDSEFSHLFSRPWRDECAEYVLRAVELFCSNKPTNREKG
ncbi:MAG: MerR family transcriptional regulator [Clostridiales bacterium]|nr:MerR family transcriptional regulator [Clostridiales bacterium]